MFFRTVTHLPLPKHYKSSTSNNIVVCLHVACVIPYTSNCLASIACRVTVLKLIKLKPETEQTLKRNKFECLSSGDMAYKPVQSSRKPHDALYKSNHAVFGSLNRVVSYIPTRRLRFASYSVPVPFRSRYLFN